jgi:hypothetical protein
MALMALTKKTQGDLHRELKQLKNERVRLDDAIAALEAILMIRAVGTNGTSASVPQPAARTGAQPAGAAAARSSRRGGRKRIKSTQVVAALLKRAGRPLSPRDIAALATEAGTRLAYDAIYSALRKSPLFVRSGAKWSLSDNAGNGSSSSISTGPLAAAPA